MWRLENATIHGNQLVEVKLSMFSEVERAEAAHRGYHRGKRFCVYVITL